MQKNTPSESKKDIIVIGSGSAGLTAAIGLKKVGYNNVTIIEKGYIGGDCTNFGCIPSKALLYRAHEVSLLRQWGLDTESYDALKGARTSRAEFRYHESMQWLEDMGIEVIQGTAKFIRPNALVVKVKKDEVFMEFKKCIIATGSHPKIPSIRGIKSIDYLTNETIFELKKPPKSLGIIGNGPIGIEMADAFASLGTKVTVISTHDHILSKSEPELADMLKSILEKKGVEFKQGLKSVNSSSNKIELKFANDTIKVDKLLVATGREPNINLDLDAALVKYNNNGIEVKRNCVTSNNSIFAIGDCCNVPRFTHMAGHMGRVLVTNLTVQKYLKLPISIMGYCKSNIPAVTFTSPELAQSGLTTGEAKSKYGKDRVKAYTLDLSGEDRLMTQNHEQGKVILVTVGPLAKIVGVHILSKRAGEILPEFQLMIQKGMRIKDLGQFIRAYPTYITKVDHLKLEWLTSIFKK